MYSRRQLATHQTDDVLRAGHSHLTGAKTHKRPTASRSGMMMTVRAAGAPSRSVHPYVIVK
jgi:hypothetical protein